LGNNRINRPVRNTRAVVQRHNAAIRIKMHNTQKEFCYSTPASDSAIRRSGDTRDRERKGKRESKYKGGKEEKKRGKKGIPYLERVPLLTIGFTSYMRLTRTDGATLDSAASVRCEVNSSLSSACLCWRSLTLW